MIKFSKIDFLLFFITVFPSISGFSQNPEKGFEALKKKDFVKAEKIFQAAVEDKNDIYAAKYGLALVYENNENPKQNLDKAFRQAVQVEKKLDKQATQSELKKYNITDESVILLKQSIFDRAFQKLKPDASLYELNSFISKYESASEINRVIKKRNEKAFAEAENENTYYAYKKFFETYTDAEQVSEAKNRFEKIWRSLYLETANDGEKQSLDEFKKNYPDYPFFDQSSARDDSLALVASRLNLMKSGATTKEYADYIKKAAPRELAYVALQRMIDLQLKSKQFKEASQTLRDFENLFPGDKRIKKMIETLTAADKNITLTDIGKNVNTIGWEYAPALTADMKNLYFCGRNRDSNLVAENEDIFVSRFENNEWQIPNPVKTINTPIAHEAPLSVSADGNTLLLYSNSDIYYTEKSAKSWTPKAKFPSVNQPRSWEADAMIAADGKTIFFISDRKENIGKPHPFSENFHGSLNGNTDIYYSRKIGNTWTEPVNLGADINTPFSERSPFLHPDMKTLYFSSEGHGSLGRLDVFKCTRLNDTSWTQWSEPVNLGKEINGPLDEYDYKISTDGKFAVFSANKNYNLDIMYVSLPPEMQPQTVTTVTGKIIDGKGRELDASVAWENLETAEAVGMLRSNPETGEYIIVLPNGKNYGFFAEKQGYYPVSGNIDLKQENTNGSFRRDIVLISVEEIIDNKVSVTMQNVFFEYDKFDLKSESFPELNRLAVFLKAHPTLRVEISGHTDNKGSAEYNNKLSQNRAESVKKFLIEKGCLPQNITAKGYGSQKPVESNDTESGRAKNRRVEFKILE